MTTDPAAAMVTYPGPSCADREDCRELNATGWSPQPANANRDGETHSLGLNNRNANGTMLLRDRLWTAKATRSPAAESTPDGTTESFGAVWP